MPILFYLLPISWTTSDRSVKIMKESGMIYGKGSIAQKRSRNGIMSNWRMPFLKS